VQLVTACDDEITVLPTSEFVNDTRTGQANFRLKTIALTGIGEGCVGKKIRLTAYTDSDSFTAYTKAGTGVTSPIAFAYNYGTTGNKFGAVGGSPLMAGCEITLSTSAGSNTDPANTSTAGGKSAASVACTLNSSTDDSTARTLTRSGTGDLLLTFQTGSTAGSIAQPVLAAAISKFALESNA